MQTDVIIISEYCEKSHIDPAFILALEEDGLIDIDMVDGQRCLPLSQLRALEQYARMHYDLAINIEGIDAIRHLLRRVTDLQEKVSQLQRRLHAYEP